MAIPAWVTNLRTRRDNITTELAAIDNNASRGNPGAKPDQGGEAGGTAHTAYRLSLLQELSQINETLKTAGDVIAAEEAAANPESFSFETVWDS